MSTNGFTVTTTIELSDSRVKGLLCSALEGGSNYWYENARMVLGDGYEKKDFYKGGRMQDPKEYWHWSQIVPFVEGCAVALDVPENPSSDGSITYTLDRAKIQEGLVLMSKEYPKHFSDLLEDNGDATTGDVFLQLALFGEVVFG